MPDALLVWAFFSVVLVLATRHLLRWLLVGRRLPGTTPLAPAARAQWEAAARQLGFADYGARMVGTLHGHPVAVERMAGGQLRIDVTGMPDLRIEPARGRLGGERTGDTSFDRQVWVAGDPALVATALDPKARHRLLEALSADLTMEGGHLLSDAPFRAHAGQIERRVRAVAEAAAAVAADAGTSLGAIHKRLRGEHAGGVRRRLLEVALDTHGRDARPLARERLHDPDPGVALVAARALPAEGTGVLRDIACRPGAEPATRAEALDELLKRGRPEAPGAAAACLAGNADPGLQASAVEVLATYGAAIAPEDRPAVCDALIAVLQAGAKGVAARAAAALAAVAGPDALRELQRIDDTALPADARAALRHAVEAVRARHVDLGGGLALAGADQGGLAVVPGGALSRPERPDPGLAAGGHPRKQPEGG